MLNRIKKELHKEWTTFYTECYSLFVIFFFTISGLIISTWWWHQDYIAWTGRYKTYLSEQEQFFKKAGQYPYDLWKKFDEEDGYNIMHPDFSIDASENP